MNWSGPVGLALIAVVAVVLIGLLALVLRLTLFRHGKARRHARAAFSGTRVEVLETTVIDEDRKLVLIRCDDVEHLIVIGGPADLVVENDVKKARGPATAPAPTQRPAQATPSQAALPAVSPARVPAAMGASLDAAIAAAAPKGSETRSTGRSTEPRSPLQQPRPGLAAVAAASSNRSNGEVSPRQRSESTARGGQRSSGSDAGRRESTPSRRAAAQPPLPQIGRPIEPQRPSARTGRSEENNALPSAHVPWPDPNSIEDEIVQALRFEPPRAAGSAPTREPAKVVVDSSATLGDLADRLEEALAREIQGVAAPTRRPEQSEGETAAPKSEEAEPERPKQASGRDRQEKREARGEQPARQSGGEQESRREAPQPDRREEAPVISLNARRREASDPLEDEMARLLGELTGDTKGR